MPAPIDLVAGILLVTTPMASEPTNMPAPKASSTTLAEPAPRPKCARVMSGNSALSGM